MATELEKKYREIQQQKEQLKWQKLHRFFLSLVVMDATAVGLQLKMGLSYVQVCGLFALLGMGHLTSLYKFNALKKRKG